METFYAYIKKDLAKTFDTAVLLTRYYAHWKNNVSNISMPLELDKLFFILKLNKLEILGMNCIEMETAG